MYLNLCGINLISKTKWETTIHMITQESSSYNGTKICDYMIHFLIGSGYR